MNDHEWQQECVYCATVADKRGNVREMNFNIRTFCTYLDMQSQQAAREGFDDAAEYIALILDDMLTLADA